MSCGILAKKDEKKGDTGIKKNCCLNMCGERSAAEVYLAACSFCPPLDDPDAQFMTQMKKNRKEEDAERRRLLGEEGQEVLLRGNILRKGCCSGVSCNVQLLSGTSIVLEVVLFFLFQKWDKKFYFQIHSCPFSAKTQSKSSTIHFYGSQKYIKRPKINFLPEGGVSVRFGENHFLFFSN